jgi:hypothetical protein
MPLAEEVQVQEVQVREAQVQEVQIQEAQIQAMATQPAEAVLSKQGRYQKDVRRSRKSKGSQLKGQPQKKPTHAKRLIKPNKGRLSKDVPYKKAQTQKTQTDSR